MHHLLIFIGLLGRKPKHESSDNHGDGMVVSNKTGIGCTCKDTYIRLGLSISKGVCYW